MKGSWMDGRPENVYASQKRLAWIASRVTARDRLLEVGCGTGAMITLPLAQAGFDIRGIDRDTASIDHGKAIATELGVDPAVLRVGSLTDVDARVDVLIVSEVLEHLPEPALDGLLGQLAGLLDAGGRLLVTVPNGYGWYEAESWVWNRSGLGGLLAGSWFERGVRFVKIKVGGYRIEQIVDPYLSSLDASPHVQRFRHRSLARRVESYGFRKVGFTGSSLFSGQLSNLLWTGIDPVTRFNNWLGGRIPALASGWYLEFERT
ncbi:MAG: methyltransferase domain-containing protein [Gammaproteobacteria bacterium]|nr:methyltransferase domain-containing protein [Gammaproteobacteria bacterium]